MRPTVRLVPLLLALFPALALGIAPARAEDPPPSEELTARFVDVGALLLGLWDFLPEQAGDLIAPWAINDEENPLFGAEGEEPNLPVGTSEELLERLRAEVAPESWQAISGALLRALGDSLVVRSRPDVVESLARQVALLEGQYLVPVVVEVRALRTGPGERPPPTLDAPAARDLFARSPAGLAATVVGNASQRSTTFGGKQVAYVGDYDTEVAEKSKILDPIILVQNFGLSVSVRPVPSSDRRRVLLGLDVRLGRLLDLGSVPGGESAPLEVPRAEVARIRSTVEVPVGVWRRLDGASSVEGGTGWAFYVRARVAAAEEPAETAGQALPALDVKSTGTFDVRSMDVGVLAQMVGDVMGETVNLVPSNFTPPEPPALGEPAPALAPDSLADLIREMVAPSVWDRGGSIDLHRAWLRVRAPRAVLSAVEGLVAACRRQFLWSVEITGESLDVPESLALEILDGAEEGRLLSPEVEARLEAARTEGSARVRDRAVVSSLRGARNAVVAGTRRAYLADYDVEVAQDSDIPNPIVKTAPSGFVLDVRPALLSSDRAALVEVRVSSQSLEEPLRRAPTPHGELTVPTMTLSRLRTTVLVPLDRTVVVGSTGEGERRLLFLLTARRTRAD